MDIEFNAQPSLIPPTLELEKAQLELFPQIWQYVEKLSAPNIRERRKGFRHIEETNAARISPLVAYLLTTRLDEPDINLRIRIIKAVSRILKPDSNGIFADELVRSQVFSSLASMGKSVLLSLLETGVAYPKLLPEINSLMNLSPLSGDLLTKISVDRRENTELRKVCISLIGSMGYSEALSALEGLNDRILSRIHGQKRMSFAPTYSENELELLAELKNTLKILHAL